MGMHSGDGPPLSLQPSFHSPQNWASMQGRYTLCHLGSWAKAKAVVWTSLWCEHTCWETVVSSTAATAPGQGCSAGEIMIHSLCAWDCRGCHWNFESWETFPPQQTTSSLCPLHFVGGWQTSTGEAPFNASSAGFLISPFLYLGLL